MIVAIVVLYLAVIVLAVNQYRSRAKSPVSTPPIVPLALSELSIPSPPAWLHRQHEEDRLKAM